MNNNQIQITSKPKNGGAREGAGRPHGSRNKLSAYTLLSALETQLGRPYAEQLAENYMTTITTGDMPMRHQYDKLFLSKIIADKVDVEVGNSTEVLAAKQAMFLAALNHASTQRNLDLADNTLLPAFMPSHTVDKPDNSETK